jgi:hypothetical protein
MKRTELRRRVSLQARNGIKPVTRALTDLDWERGLRPSTSPSKPNPPRQNPPGTRPRSPGFKRRRNLVGNDSTRWVARVFRTHGDVCWVSGRPAVHAHHVVTVQQLDKELTGKGYTLEQIKAACRDERNGMPLAPGPHDAHHRPGVNDGRIPRSLLAPCHWEFAAEHGLEWLLERNYPDNQEDKT